MKLRTKIIIVLSAILAFIFAITVIVFGGLYLSFYISQADMRQVESRESECKEFLLNQRPFLKTLPSNIVTNVDFSAQESHEPRRVKGIQETWADFEYYLLFPQKDIVIIASYNVGLDKNWKPKTILSERVVALEAKPKKLSKLYEYTMRSYHGRYLDETQLGKYLKELEYTGDVSTIRAVLQEGVDELNVFNDVTDPIYAILKEGNAKKINGL